VSKDCDQTNTDFLYQDLFESKVEVGALGELDLSMITGGAPGAPHLHLHTNAPRDQVTVQLTQGRCSILFTCEMWELKNMAAAVNAFLIRWHKDGKGRDGKFVSTPGIGGGMAEAGPKN
jgi:hypothetical protein